MSREPSNEVKRELLECLRRKYDHRSYVHPDPIELLYRYESADDREIVGLLSSCLAYGRVRQILKNVGDLLAMMQSPRRFVEESSCTMLHERLCGFKHRFTRADQMVDLLCQVRLVLKEYGSLRECFVSGMNHGADSLIPAMNAFAAKLNGAAPKGFTLVPSPENGSACKRLNLYLRWMVRKDNVDLGDWAEVIPKSQLIVPLDTHLHRISLNLGLTERKQADFRTASEITEQFKQFDADDPVRYDFSLTRLGIRKGIRTYALWKTLSDEREALA